jgi:curli biogenesis system outer membrane secretion channel CsgG
MRRFAPLSVLLLAATWLWMAPVAAQTARPTVALMNFDFGTITDHWWGNQDIGAGIADLIVDALVDDGSFRVFERKKLNALLAEQNFANSERADPSAKTVAQIGKALGVKYLIVGSITKFGSENSKKGVGGGGFGSKFGIGSVGKSEGKANVAITARIVDTSTGEIMLSAKGDGTSKRSGLMLGGAGGGGGGAAGGGINFSSSDFKDTIIGEATEMAVKTTVAQMIAKKDRLN